MPIIVFILLHANVVVVCANRNTWKVIIDVIKRRKNTHTATTRYVDVDMDMEEDNNDKGEGGTLLEEYESIKGG